VRCHILAAVLLLLFAGRAWHAASLRSCGFDEPFHFAVGASAWKTGDFRLSRDGFLPPLLATCLARSPQLDPQDPAWLVPEPWQLGHRWLFATPAGAADLHTAQALMIGVGVALGVALYLWSLRLHGPPGALLSLALYSFCPNFLGHTSLVGTDVSAALAYTLAVAAAWHTLRRPGAAGVVLAAVAIATLFLTKVSALIFLALAALLGALRRDGRAALRLGLALGLAWMLMWAFFGFAYTRYWGPAPQLPWAELTHGRGPLEALRGLKLLPEPMLYGIADVLGRTHRAAWLAGHYGTWFPQYFPLAAAVKLPLGTLVLLLAGLLARRDPERLPLLAWAGLFWAAALMTPINIGFRHILPGLPPLFILAGALARKKVWVGLALVAVVAESLVCHPRYLSFFNLLGGGGVQGYRLLSDGSLDLGQELPELSRWLQNHRGESVYVSYFGTDSPARFGVQTKRLPGYLDLDRQPALEDWGPGLYVFSAAMLVNIYPDIRTCFGPWNPTQEARYVRAAAELPRAIQGPNWAAAAFEFDSLRLTRLRSRLSQRPPDESVGDTWKVYRVTVEDLR